MHADISFEKIEKIAIEQALLRRKGDMLQSAQELGMPRKAFLDKIKKYGLCLKPLPVRRPCFPRLKNS